MSQITLNVRAAKEVDPDTDAAFRMDFLNTVCRVGVGQDEVVALVEASSGRPFAACVAADLIPVLRELLALARCVHTTVDARPACGV